MNNDRELMQQALEALEKMQPDVQLAEGDAAIAALRERLAQPEQEPFGYFQLDLRLDAWVQNRNSNKGVAFYTTPPRREWVGLDRKEMLAIIDQQQASKQTGLPMFYRDQCLDMARAIEAKLREKNA